MPLDHALDRRRRAAWIFAVSGLLIVPACAAPSDDDVESASQGIAVSGAWKPPADVSSVGATMSVAYDGAPRWTGSSGCGSGLKQGTRKLGAFLQDKYDAISSIGGFACRQNTANRSKTSVHGTGRAMDIFIPKIRGAADNGKGDPVANWLVVNAETIGVQLVIWDRTVWYPGRAPKAYTGPHPHDDHIHMEITSEAAAMKTEFFTTVGGGTTDPDDNDTAPDDTETDDTTETDEHEDDPAPEEEDASTPTDPPPSDPTPTQPAPSDPAPTDPKAPDAQAEDAGAPAAEPTPQTAPSSAAPSEGELDPDGPGETDSLPDEEKPKKKRSPAGYATASAGCAMAGSTAPAGGPTAPLGSVALGAVVLGWVRARRRGR